MEQYDLTGLVKHEVCNSDSLFDFNFEQHAFTGNGAMDDLLGLMGDVGGVAAPTAHHHAAPVAGLGGLDDLLGGLGLGGGGERGQGPCMKKIPFGSNISMFSNSR